MKVVFDANTLISAYIVRKGISGQIIQHRTLYIGVATDEILEEVNHSLYYERIQKKYSWSNQSVGTYLATVIG
jgi:predicted nucleic acid-binding protein